MNSPNVKYQENISTYPPAVPGIGILKSCKQQTIPFTKYVLYILP